MYLLFSFTIGGTERLITDICNTMCNKGNNVYLYIVNDLYDKSMLNLLDKKIHVEMQRRKISQGKKVKTLFKIARYIYMHKIDVVHCNALNTPEILLIAKLVKPSLKVYYTIHGMEQYKNLSKIRIIYRNILCRKIIAISESVKKDIIKSGANKDKIEVVYNAINVNNYKKAKKQIMNMDKQRIFNSDNIVIGNIARFSPELKGQDILINAIDILRKTYPTIKCIFAGSPDKFHKEIFFKTKKRIEEYNLSNNIEMAGNITDIPVFLNNIDIFVLPSRLEGFGISLLEAMSMGIPCIASRLYGPEEVLDFGKRGHLFKPGDVYDLVKVINAVINNYEEEKKRAEINVTEVYKKYSIESMCNKLLVLYSV